MSDDSRQPSQAPVVIAFGVSIAASIGLLVVYFAGGQPQIEGSLIAASLGGLAVGLITWAHRFLPGGHDVQEKTSHRSSEKDRAAFESDLARGEAEIQRRSVLGGLLAAAFGTLGVAALFPIRSLGTAPGNALYTTRWTAGARVVTEEGEVVADNSLDVGGILTVFPEGFVGSADSQAVLLRVAPEQSARGPHPEWSPQGYIAYSKICTHAGCPVGLYQPESKELFCPCHQSVFDVLNGAKPVGGPATRPLPQLPLTIDDFGQIRAQGDFSTPVGPGFWKDPAK
jgi:ubiquinol-cytochrome c reductase iron-sulfur subunit